MLRPHRRTHAWIWSLAAVLLPLILIGGLVLKYTRPPLPQNVRLSAPAGAAAPAPEAKP